MQCDHLKLVSMVTKGELRVADYQGTPGCVTPVEASSKGLRILLNGAKNTVGSTPSRNKNQKFSKNKKTHCHWRE